jgi:hypothetical protein
MAGAFQFGYGNPSNFSDWAAYAGMDRKTGMMRPMDESNPVQATPKIPETDMSTGIPPVVPPSISTVPPMGAPSVVMPTSSMGGTTSSLGYVMKHFGD